ncbi:hypothetical protein [Novosphingobium sp. Gsoil 351]|uniref:hypothetical protein n=1 Tax=Novosphingobium sp. Gsoil 351 TaxID=2675225 RepID=UPI001E313148|nr:hypothetical protein [Novosphingobium sp. Gsoil 351]
MPQFVPTTSPLPDPSQKALHFVPPTVRERRAQAVHRLQVGLFGLAGMLLLVGLANIIMDRAKISDDATAASSAAAVTAAKVSPEGSASPANDPLADIGVVPDMPAAGPSTGASGAARPPG